MRKHITVILLLLCSIVAMAQRRGYYGRAGGIFTVSLHVKDSLSGENVSFASVYLKPAKDTIITNFTLTDQEGKAVIRDVTRGQYTLNVEILGYKPYVKALYLSNYADIGTILLKEDVTMLEAAKVSAALDPMEIRGDTLVYNASAFSITQSDMLKDLLKKMPGIEVGEDGSVTVQGESVSQITVNGKTFFMGDKRAALDNLPAHIVNKVKVTGDESDEARFTGIRRGGSSKGKKMDVELKQEYKKGVFGNLTASGGASVPSEEQEAMVADLPFLWNGSGLLSGFSEKDQFTILGRAQNVNSSDMVPAAAGITSGGQAGANWTTDRIKKFDTGVSLYYNSYSKEDASRSSTTDYPISGEEVNTENHSSSLNGNDSFNANFDIKSKKESKILLNSFHRFSFNNRSSSSNSSSSSDIDGLLQNSSTSEKSASDQNLGYSGSLNMGFGIPSKKNRKVTMSARYSGSAGQGNSIEYSKTEYARSGTSLIRDLRYDNTSGSGSGSLDLGYVEPISKKVLIETKLSGSVNHSRQDRQAFNPDGSINDYYTSRNRNSGTGGKGSLLLQYSDDSFFLQAGVSAFADNLYKYSRNLGVETEIGKDEWLFKWAPSINVEIGAFDFEYRGESSQPSISNMMPVLDITNPVRLSTGNVNLRPSFSHHLNLHVDLLGRTFLSIDYVIHQGQTVLASWFDADHVNYRVPVNAKKPGETISARIFSLGFFDKKKRFSYQLTAPVSYSKSVNYQAEGVLPGMDINSFDYSSFMASFWGDPSGNVFYSGGSGFKESITRRLSYSTNLSLVYRGINGFSATISNSFAGNNVWYSLDKQADSDTYEYKLDLRMQYNTAKGYKFDGRYIFSRYFGFSDSFAKTNNALNFSIYKDIRDFTLSFKAMDILNDGIMISHAISETSVTDSYRLSLGRHVMFGIVWHFGKVGASRMKVANSASKWMTPRI